MKKKTLDSYIHNPGTNPIIQEVTPVKIRSDHLVDVHEAKRMLKAVSAQKLYYHCAKGNLPLFVNQGSCISPRQFSGTGIIG